jgi:hypothetical protein
MSVFWNKAKKDPGIRNEAMKQLFKDREAYKSERSDARQRGDSSMAHSLNGKIANCTRKLNILLMISLDEAIARHKDEK